jgi:hypothetical protein
VPVGAAWQRLISERPDLVLHDKDNSHPNVAGSFLAACVFYAMLFNRSPVGLSAALPALGQLDRDVLHYIENVAWRMVARGNNA